jgi:hypothetical protein
LTRRNLEVWLSRKKVPQMERMSIHDTDDAVTSITALREVLHSELSAIERMVRKVHTSPDTVIKEDAEEIMETYQRLRTSLLSGIASVDEVLGWVRILAPKDPEGNELDSVRSLPYMTSVISKS